MYTTAYTSELKPIEEAFSKVESVIKMAGSSLVEPIGGAIGIPINY